MIVSRNDTVLECDGSSCGCFGAVAFPTSSSREAREFGRAEGWAFASVPRVQLNLCFCPECVRTAMKEVKKWAKHLNPEYAPKVQRL